MTTLVALQVARVSLFSKILLLDHRQRNVGYSVIVVIIISA